MTQQLEEGETTSPSAECVPVEGRRKRGGGRPRKGTFAALQGDLTFAKDFLSLVMRSIDQPIALRVRSAIAVLLKGSNNGAGATRAFYFPDDSPLKPAEVPELASEPEPG
jgi:hypothetical protein